MPFHRALHQPLGSPEETAAMYAGFHKELMNADGYYALVQEIAEVYGEKAYDIAAEVFAAEGMDFSIDDMKKLWSVRRVDYTYTGNNVYDIRVKRAERAADLIWLYNREIRLLSRDLLMDNASAESLIGDEGLFMAYCGGRRTGFVHCAVRDGVGSVDAFIRLPGAIHYPTEKCLIAAADGFFTEKNATSVRPLMGCADYPHFKLGAGDELLGIFNEKLPHIGGGILACIDPKREAERLCR